MSEGKFIVFSGGEGSGKSTVLARLAEEYPQIIATREPGGTPLGTQLRGLLLNDPSAQPDPMAELMLFMADRAEHIAKVIRPALASGLIVITDRHWQDTFAYQWYAKMGRSDRREFGGYMDPAWPQPIWVWFDVEPKVGLQRRHATGEVNRFDAADLTFHTRVREGFKLLYHPEFYGIRIDANQSPDEVYANVKAALATYL